jgi:hypothetical protein
MQVLHWEFNMDSGNLDAGYTALLFCAIQPQIDTNQHERCRASVSDAALCRANGAAFILSLGQRPRFMK